MKSETFPQNNSVMAIGTVPVKCLKLGAQNRKSIGKQTDQFIVRGESTLLQGTFFRTLSENKTQPSNKASPERL